MKALRLKLYQNLVNYRREMSYGYVQTYPLPTPSMVRGMAHALLGVTDEYKPLSISIQGYYDSVTTNLQKVYKFDRYRKENVEKLEVIHTPSKQMLNQGVQFVDLIVNMNLLLHIVFEDESLTIDLFDAVREKTVVLGRNEDIAYVDFTDTGLVDVKKSLDEITLNYNAYLLPDLCEKEQLSGTHYRLPFYYDKITSCNDKRIFHFANAVYIAKGNKIENVSFMKDSKGDLVSLLEADH